MTRRPRRDGTTPSTAWMAGAMIAIAGCGADAGAPAAPEPPPPAAPDPRAEPHIADAQAEVDAAERRIDQIVGPGGSLAMRSDDAEKKEEEGDEAAGSCDTACRALGAMERAQRHLCQLAGDRDARCEAARDRVQRAVERVRASCGGCHAA